MTTLVGVPRSAGPAAPPCASSTYVDEARTHEVRLYVAGPDDARVVHVVESAFGDTDPAAVLCASHPVREAWEVRYHKAALEARLGMLGSYWRSDGGLWMPVPRRPALVDLDAVVVDVGARQAGIHHFHSTTRPTRVLLAMAPDLRHADRALLAELQMEALETIDARLLHPALPLGPLRSALADEHLRARDAGYAKLRTPTEFGLVYGPDWKERLTEAIVAGVRRLAAPVEKASAARAEDDGMAIVSHEVLNDPRLLRIHRRFLAPDEEAGLLRDGEHAIRRSIAQKRRSALAQDQHLLSILEASLLVRERLARRSKVDKELVDRVDRLSYYLGARPKPKGQP